MQLADKLLTSVTMRRPTVGDLMDCPVSNENDTSSEVRLLSRLCGLNVEDMRLLDLADYMKLTRQFLSFRIGDAEEKK